MKDYQKEREKMEDQKVMEYLKDKQVRLQLYVAGAECSSIYKRRVEIRIGLLNYHA